MLTLGPSDREIFRIRDEITAHESDPAATFYDILGIPPNASQDDINKAYRKKTRSLHPDKVKQQLKADRVKASSNRDTKGGVHVAKPPTAAEIKTAVKQAGDRQARLSLIANILRGPSRARYDHFLSNGFPLWKGTDYYYNRYRPGLGTAVLGVFIVGGGAIHYLILYMSWKRQKEFVERYVKFARETAWGNSVGIPGVDSAPAPAPAPATPPEEEGGPPQPVNRRQRRMQEKETKKEDGRGRVKKVSRKVQAQSVSRDASSAPAPSGVRKRVVAENGKILVVDSLGHVFLEGEDDEGNVDEFLLDVSLQPFRMADGPSVLTLRSPTSSTSLPSRTPPSCESLFRSSTWPGASSLARRTSPANRMPPTSTTTRMRRSTRPVPTPPARTLRCSTRARTR